MWLPTARHYYEPPAFVQLSVLSVLVLRKERKTLRITIEGIAAGESWFECRSSRPPNPNQTSTCSRRSSALLLSSKASNCPKTDSSAVASIRTCRLDRVVHCQKCQLKAELNKC